MPKIDFYKYQGAGNDFVVIDNRKKILSSPNQKWVAQICHRNFGVGADGLMLLQASEDADFEMVYYNADGNLGSMCGNGARCIVAFANFLGIIEDSTTFKAYDGLHEATIRADGQVELQMSNPADVNIQDDYCFLDTGSPHHIEFVESLQPVDVYKEGKAIRNNDHYREQGVNVNFVEVTGRHQLFVLTYERGVEAETLACGTGVTAAALAYFLKETNRPDGKHNIVVDARGGQLEVRFRYFDGTFFDIVLCGPAQQVYQGSISI